MQLVIAEKPSVAMALSKVLGAKSRGDGYMEGGGWLVSWCIGHLVELAPADAYDPRYSKWNYADLPILPEPWQYQVLPDTKKQFETLKSLMHRADVTALICATDAGREGELIFRLTYHLCGCTKPVKRLWISSMEETAIRKGFDCLLDGKNYDNLYAAALCRAKADWLIGINGTRLFTTLYQGKTLNVGRVQTPTLALIVQRQNEIDNFTPQDYWELKTVYRDATFSAVDGRFKTEDEAQAVVGRISAVPLVIRDVADKKGREAPPRLFDLTSLQVECNRKWGWTADDTLKTIQSLYEKKVTTYPRVDTTYLSDDIYPKVPDIMRRMTPYARWTEPVLAVLLTSYYVSSNSDCLLWWLSQGLLL